MNSGVDNNTRDGRQNFKTEVCPVNDFEVGNYYLLDDFLDNKRIFRLGTIEPYEDMVVTRIDPSGPINPGNAQVINSNCSND